MKPHSKLLDDDQDRFACPHPRRTRASTAAFDETSTRLLNSIHAFCVMPSQPVGGALFVDTGSTLDVMHEITFRGNSLAIMYHLELVWVSAQAL